MKQFLELIGAKWAIVFAFDDKGKLRLHLAGEPGSAIQLLKIVAASNEILDRLAGIFKPSTITPPNKS
jgi:hypothetical protein